MRARLLSGAITPILGRVAGGGLLPAATSNPFFTGPAVTGAPLTVDVGTWVNGPMVFAYAWYKDGALISGQADASYLVSHADAGSLITCVVRATNANGVTLKTVTPSAVAIVGAPAFNVSYKNATTVLSNVNRTASTPTNEGGMAMVLSSPTGNQKWAVGFKLSNANGAIYGLWRRMTNSGAPGPNAGDTFIHYSPNNYIYNFAGNTNVTLYTTPNATVVTFAVEAATGTVSVYAGSSSGSYLVYTQSGTSGPWYPVWSDGANAVGQLVVPFLPAGYSYWG